MGPCLRICISGLYHPQAAGQTLLRILSPGFHWFSSRVLKSMQCLRLSTSSNCVQLYPVLSLFTAPSFMNLFLDRHFSLNGVPFTIQSDRGRQFMSDEFQLCVKSLQTTSKLSLTSRQKSSGRVENQNKRIEVYFWLTSIRTKIGLSSSSWRVCS